MIEQILMLGDYHQALRRDKRFKEADVIRRQVRSLGAELRSYPNGWTIAQFPEFPERVISLGEEALLYGSEI